MHCRKQEKIIGEAVEDRFVIIGAGGHAKTVLDVLIKNKYKVVGFTDAALEKGVRCLGAPVLGKDDVLRDLFEQGIQNAAMGIGHVGKPCIRSRLYQSAIEIGFSFPNLMHPTAVISEFASLGKGTLFAPQCVVNADAKIGNLCIINTSAVVEHEAALGNGVHIAPHATVLGGSCIGEDAFIGAGSVILQGIRIGARCIIGAGSIVLEDVEDDCVVVGNPAGIRKRRRG